MVLGVGLLLGGGCGGGDRVEEVGKSVESWRATVDVVAGEWAEHRVPRVFVRQVVEAAGKGLDEDEKRLEKISGESQGRERVRQRLVEVRGRVKELSTI